jgi:hypothetical protein
MIVGPIDAWQTPKTADFDLGARRGKASNPDMLIQRQELDDSAEFLRFY